MGARAPPSVRPRRGGFKCEFCGRILISAEGLLSHQHSLHSYALKEQEKKRKVLRPASKAIQKPNLLKKVVSKAAKVTKEAPKVKAKKMPLVKEKSKTPELNQDEKSVSKPELVKEVPVKASVKKVNVKSDVKMAEEKEETQHSGVKSSGKKKVEFKCPECEKLFPVYFSAMKHIQKHHNVNGKGQKVSLDAPNLRPILIEFCDYCETTYSGTHTCPHTEVDLLSYVCTGCDQSFSTMKMFDIHISGVHSDCVESLFFSTKTEFNDWKQDMEKQTESKYAIMGTYCSKLIYRCSHASDNDNNIARFCPSTIVTQEFPKGLQVHFYKDHSGHASEEYVLFDKYKSNLLTDILQQREGYPDMLDFKLDENDLYLQFKTLMETLVIDAARINIDTLKVLVQKAVDMTTIVTNYDEDIDFVTPANNTLISPKLITYENTSKDIKTALDSIRSSQRIKRKISLETPTSNKKAKNVTNVAAKSPILTKGKKVSMFSLANDKDSDKILKELDNDANKISKGGKGKRQSPSNDEIENLKDTTPLQPKTNKFGSPSFNDSYKDFIQTIKKPDTNKKKIKTKIGQFKPSISPKNTSVTKSVTKPVAKSRRSSSGNVKEIEYEVKERENDCNILILKI